MSLTERFPEIFPSEDFAEMMFLAELSSMGQDIIGPILYEYLTYLNMEYQSRAFGNKYEKRVWTYLNVKN
jgi:hypothetical protein